MKTQAHTRYRNAKGEIIPGVTTIVGQLDKPQLVLWANRLGLQGIDSTKYRDEAAEIGTLAHYLIMCHLKGEKPDTSDYSANQIDKAENCLLSYLEWEKGHKLQPTLIEKPLVSEAHQFGGTPDFYGIVDGRLALIDYKTGGIYEQAYIQACAYCRLLWENNYPPFITAEIGKEYSCSAIDKVIILGIPRDENDAFKEEIHTDIARGWEIFKHLRAIYDLRKGGK